MSIIEKYAKKIKGQLSTFDRMIFKGHILQFFSTSGKRYFMSQENVLLKDFSQYAQVKTEEIKACAKTMATEQGRPYEYLNSPKISKEQTALKYLKESPIENGLICVLPTVELCDTLQAIKNQNTQKLELRNVKRKCIYIYFYSLDKDFGFMHVKLQTWFPFTVQIYINGREWLSKELDKNGILYTRYDNCFTDIDDIEKAQELADKIESIKLSHRFDAIVQRINPFISRISEIFGQGYYWCLDQCEYATDIMFNNREDLKSIYPSLVDHALTSFNSEDVMVFLGRKIHPLFQGEVVTDKKKRQQGVRIKHKMKSNLIKMYDKDSVLRIETTINDPKEFKILKETKTKTGETVYRYVPMGKSIANLYRYAEVSKGSNKRYTEALSEATPASEVIVEIEKLSEKIKSKDKTYTGYSLLSEETTRLFSAVMDGGNFMNGFRNKDVFAHLYPDANPKDKKLRNKVTRVLAKLRAHKLISKIPHSTKYKVCKKGLSLMSAILKVKAKDVPRLVLESL